jgi:hypothetical protein
MAEAFLKTTNTNQPLNGINCPRYIGRTKDEAIKLAIQFVDSRGKSAVHDIKWNSTNLDFNVEFSNEYWDDGRVFSHYRFTKHGTAVYLVLTRNSEDGHPLTARIKGARLCGSKASRNELNDLRLDLGRYETSPIPREQSMLLGAPSTEQWFDMCFISEVSHKTEQERLGTPGVTIATPRIDQPNATGSGTPGTNWVERTGYKSVLQKLASMEIGSSEFVECPSDLDVTAFAVAVRGMISVNCDFKYKFSVLVNKEDHAIALIRK